MYFGILKIISHSFCSTDLLCILICLTAIQLKYSGIFSLVDFKILSSLQVGASEMKAYFSWLRV